MGIEEKCLCGATDYRRALKGIKFSIYACRKCGLARTYPVPRPDYAGEEGLPERDLRSEQYSRKFAMQIIRQIKKVKGAGRLLDVGSGRGMLLRVAKENGFEPLGVEISRKDSEYSRKHHGVAIVTADFLSANLQGKFDVIVMNHFLEHIENPAGVLKRAKELLSKGGILFIGLPNYDGLWRRLQGEAWYPYQPTQHIWQYSPETLTAVLRLAGFTPIQIMITSVEHSLIMQPLNILFVALGQGDNLNVIAKAQ
ncbi:class I SAM-dependent methyltransferase [Candidatus Woesearchaeota archaeon]|nr:class I SAM-dependent methyltransferase [Candidatus Woesearchaeota archaeon]